MRIVTQKNDIKVQHLSYKALSMGQTSGVWTGEEAGAEWEFDAIQKTGSFTAPKTLKDSPLQ